MLLKDMAGILGESDEQSTVLCLRVPVTGPYSTAWAHCAVQCSSIQFRVEARTEVSRLRVTSRNDQRNANVADPFFFCLLFDSTSTCIHVQLLTLLTQSTTAFACPYSVFFFTNVQVRSSPTSV
jgi:hypothetical protein